MIIKNYFYKKGFALGLLLKQRLVASRKWPITIAAYSLVILHLIGFFLSTQYPRNISGVHSVLSLTVRSCEIKPTNLDLK